MLYFNLLPVFKARQIDRPYTFMVKIGISPQTASKYLNNYVHVMRLDHVEKLCIALHCEPNELLCFNPSNKKPVEPDHPIQKLRQKETSMDLNYLLKTIPLAQLEEVAKVLVAQKKDTNL